MELPLNFSKDIQSKSLSIITRVEIGNENKIYLSTHNLNFDGNYYKPLLLGVPSMKESVDHESRNFKISNVTLKISNYEFNGERFSDSFKDNPLINEEVNIYWNTQTALTSDETLLIFKGYVRRVSHTDSEATIQLEDLTELRLHKTLPEAKTSTSESVGGKYRGVPIPMAFGHLENAPTVMDAGRILKADSDESIEIINEDSENYESHPIWSDFEDYYVDGFSPIKMVVDDVTIYIPKIIYKSIKKERLCII